MSIKKRRCDKTVKTSVVEAGKQTNRASIDSEVFELASRHHSARLFWSPIMRIKKVVTSVTTFFLH